MVRIASSKFVQILSRCLCLPIDFVSSTFVLKIGESKGQCASSGVACGNVSNSFKSTFISTQMFWLKSCEKKNNIDMVYDHERYTSPTFIVASRPLPSIFRRYGGVIVLLKIKMTIFAQVTTKQGPHPRDFRWTCPVPHRLILKWTYLRPDAAKISLLSTNFWIIFGTINHVTPKSRLTLPLVTLSWRFLYFFYL